MSIMVFLVVAVAAGIAFHRLMAGVLTPSLLSGVVSVALFHLIGFVVEGTLDSLVMISAITTFVLAFSIALGIGVAMRQSGNKKTSVNS